MSNPAYSTHQPILKYFLEKYNGKVLELGCGDFSTDLIIQSSTWSVSLEDNLEWYQKFSDKDSEYHEIKFVRSWKESLADVIRRLGHLDLVFVDQANFQSRCEALTILKDSAKILLLHDSFDQHLSLCKNNIVQEYKFKKNFYVSLPPDPTYPPTMALSNEVDITDLEIDGTSTL